MLIDFVGENSFHVKRIFPHTPFKKSKLRNISIIPKRVLEMGARGKNLVPKGSSLASQKFISNYSLKNFASSIAQSTWYTGSVNS